MQRTLFDPEPPADVCRNKHGGAPTSVEAFKRAAVSLSQRRAEVLAIIRSFGEHGATMKEVADIMCVQLNCVSGRGTDLVALGKVRKTERRRGGGVVLVSTEVR